MESHVAQLITSSSTKTFLTPWNAANFVPCIKSALHLFINWIIFSASGVKWLSHQRIGDLQDHFSFPAGNANSILVVEK
jgi:hypothetical protein